MVKISNASYENKIPMVDSPFNEDSKNIYFLAREALISGEDGRKIQGKWSKTGKPIVMQIREWSQSLCIVFVFLYVRSHYLLKTEEVSFQTKFSPTLRPFPP